MHLFDSNILIYHLNDVLPRESLEHVEAWIAEGAFISVVTRIEVLGYPEQTNAQFRRAAQLVNYFAEVPLEEAVVQRTIDLRQRQRIRLGDAVVAASALEQGAALITRNTADFRWIDELTVINPFEA